MQRFSQAQLRRCNGRDGAPAYFAYEGRVYDATRSFHWQAGRHQVIHSAGGDLTAQVDSCAVNHLVFAGLPLETARGIIDAPFVGEVSRRPILAIAAAQLRLTESSHAEISGERLHRDKAPRVEGPCG